MTQYIEVIHDITNDEVTQREYSTAEIKAAKEAEELLKQQLAKEADAIAAKKAATAKLAALGLTTDDLKALGLGGN